MYRPLPSCLTIKNSEIHGLGVFALESIDQGTDLGIAHVKMVEWLKFPQDFCRTPLGGFYNHSDDPNCKLIDSGVAKRLITVKNIKEGEEITCSYTLYNLEIA
ncbi:uncharacterized protein METZ01_LOCUS378351 [marine metagenome]|uniref:SET domain-containing protein n=1 Tax=marine metagenome TaxID=408172 RepID=A0A382TV49_9ZZZZ